MKKNNTKKNINNVSKKRRTNAILYPIYKMFSWDLLSFFSIEFLFYTITKGLSPSQVLVLASVYVLSKVLLQIPTAVISEYLGKRKSIILGNVFVTLYVILLILSPNMLWIMIANVFCALGYDLKNITEGNLLYDSVATKGGDGIYTKIDSKGTSGYYILDTVLSVMAGYLFVINNYIPMFICLFFMLISTMLSIKFEEIYEIKKNKAVRFSKFLKDYSSNIASSLSFIKRSKRMKAYLLFSAIFYGLIKIMSTYKSNLLTNIGVTEEQFTMIYAVFSLIAAISVTFSRKIQRYFKNQTLTFISLIYIISVIFSGMIAIRFTNNVALPLVLMFFSAIRICDSQWYITGYTYLKNFTTPESRSKISFTYELITGIGTSVLSLIGAFILEYVDIKYAMILIGLAFLAIMVMVLDYMKTRFGLKPNQYKKQDIEFTIEGKRNVKT